MTPNESTVINILQEIVRSKGLPAPNLTPDTLLDARLGLESLDFAELVVRMEEHTGKDPFASEAPQQIHTISDLAALYEATQ